MKKYIALIVNLIIYNIVIAQTPVNDKNWTLYFEDNFDGTTVDNSKWDFKPHWGNCVGDDGSVMTNPYKGGTNHQVSNGTIKLILKEEIDTCYNWDKTFKILPYTTGELYSKKAFKYGYFEIRCKMPELSNTSYTGKGVGRGFCMWPPINSTDPYSNVTWSEIDIFEIFGEGNLYTSNVHYSDIDHPNKKDTTIDENGDMVISEHPYWTLKPWDDTEYDFNINFTNFHKFSQIFL